MTDLPDGVTLDRIEPDRLDAWMRQVSRQFGEVLHDDQVDSIRASIGPDVQRAYALYDGGAIVGTGINFSFSMTVPGGAQLGCAGVSGIGVQTTHRRRGLLRTMMRQLTDDAVQRGEPLAALLATESSIYGRFGFGPAMAAQKLRVAKPYAAVADPVAASLELLPDDAAARRLLPPLYERVQRGRNGMIAPAPNWWDAVLNFDPEHDREGFSPRYHVVAGDRGYATYRIKGDWDDTGPAGVLKVVQLVAADAATEAALWQFCFDVDLVTCIEARRRPADDTMPLLLAEPTRVRRCADEPIYLRLVDLPAALEARSYAMDGTLVLDVRDAFLPANAGTWHLEAHAGQVAVQRTAQPADLALDVGDLSAAYLGGLRFGQLARALRVTEHAAGALARADAMFAVEPQPWQPFGF